MYVKIVCWRQDVELRTRRTNQANQTKSIFIYFSFEQGENRPPSTVLMVESLLKNQSEL